MNAIVLWKPVEKALTALSKKPTYQTFLNKFSNSVGKTITSKTVIPYVKTEIAAGGARSAAVKSTLLGAAFGVAGDETYELVRDSILGSAADERELKVLQNVVDGANTGSIANAISETLDDSPTSTRGIENFLVEAAVKTVEESMTYASVLVNFAGSVASAKALMLALRNADVTDFDVYERLRGY